MNGSELRALRQHPDPDVRRRAMTLFFDRYRDNQLVLTHVFNNVVKEFNTTKDLRHYPSAISRRNIGNDLDDESVRILHDITTESYSLVQRYYRLKSRLIQLPDMTLADIYAPMPDASERFSWDESKAIILDGFSKFDATFYQMAKQMFDENRIDAHVEPRKRGGAFCSGSTPYVKPYVMMNFLGRQSDISTLAHELGHAIHDMLAAKQSLFNFHPILPLAETASVFCEMIITDKLLAESRDDATKIAILTDKLEDIFATSHRQNMFSRFEMAIHDRIPNTLMSQHDFCEMYHRELQTMFGDSVRITPEYHWEWSSIPHMISYPFYVYAYNFGNLLVMALYQQYKEEGPSFVPKLTQFLSSGSSLSPMDICSFVNADIRDPNFWRKSITLIESMLTQLEALV